jgi:hypothetical protein
MRMIGYIGASELEHALGGFFLFSHFKLKT